MVHTLICYLAWDMSVQAILGGSVQVPTLTGDVLLKVSCLAYLFILYLEVLQYITLHFHDFISAVTRMTRFLAWVV